MTDLPIFLPKFLSSSYPTKGSRTGILPSYRNFAGFFHARARVYIPIHIR